MRFANSIGEMKLVRGIKKGKTENLRILYERYINSLYRYVYYRVGLDKHITEDIVQETFLSAIKDIHRINFNKGNFFSFLIGIARHKIPDALKKKETLSKLEIALETIDQLLVSDYPLPDEMLMKDELSAIVGSVMSCIKEKYKNVLEKRYIQDLSVPQIARLYGMSTKAIEALLFRARKSFRQVFRTTYQELLFLEKGGG